MRIKTKQQAQVEQQFLYNFAQIIEAFPQYKIGEHLGHFLRKKGSSTEFYYWSNELLLQKIEEYYNELKETLAMPDYYSDNDD
jgi:hypothetical protein